MIKMERDKYNLEMEEIREAIEIWMRNNWPVNKVKTITFISDPDGQYNVIDHLIATVEVE